MSTNKLIKIELLTLDGSIITNIPYNVEANPDYIKFTIKESDISPFASNFYQDKKNFIKLYNSFLNLSYFSTIKNNLFSDELRSYIRFFSKDEVQRFLNRDLNNKKLYNKKIQRNEIIIKKIFFNYI